MQPTKQHSSREVIKGGIEISVNSEHPRKQDGPMNANEFGRVMLFNLEQL
jgi:hypothetical protein